MAIETFEFIDDLVAANPTATDNVSEGDDHLRGLKTTLKNTLPNITGAITATEAELNILDGVTATTAELNLIDGVTATTAELNYTDGVTSAIQTQLDAKLPLAGGTMTGAITTLSITETEATSAATTYTVDLANGTLFEVTSATTCTVTMPTAAAGKSFTVISTVPAAWSGTILWSGGAAPTTGSAKTIYSFISNGSSWYGMQAGTGFA